MSTRPADGQSQDDLRDHSIGDLLEQLSQETSTLVKQELALARAELQQQGKRAGVGAGLFGAAGAVGLLAGGALTAFLILLLDEVMKDWLAALIVALVLGAVAAVLALRGKKEMKEVQGLPKTADTVKKIPDAVKGNEEANR